jgi:hypothetical protein
MAVGRPRADRQLAQCRDENMSCHECVRSTAASLMRISADVPIHRARQMFQIMYPEPACQSAAAAFLQVIQAEQPAIPRRGPVSVPRIAEPLFVVAVA